jgi:molybdenum cofactor guanylyltransferase
VILGLVLAGGRSSRFGREKALADLDGEPFIARIVAVLEAGCQAVAINAPAESGAAAFAAERGLACLPDPPDAPDGPLAGLMAGLAWAAEGCAPCLCTAPCDTPRLPSDMVARLGAALPPDARAVVALTDDGLQPLCGLWRVEALATLRRLTAGGEHPAVRAALAAVGGREVRFDDAPAFRNVNTPADYAAL